MRESCKDCARKHLGSAIVLESETVQGYPLHAFIAIGHLNEASDELIKDYPDLAERIRQARLDFAESVNRELRINEDGELYFKGELHSMDLLSLIADVTLQHISEIPESEED